MVILLSLIKGTKVLRWIVLISLVLFSIVFLLVCVRYSFVWDEYYNPFKLWYENTIVAPNLQLALGNLSKTKPIVKWWWAFVPIRFFDAISFIISIPIIIIGIRGLYQVEWTSNYIKDPKNVLLLTGVRLLLFGFVVYMGFNFIEFIKYSTSDLSGLGLPPITIFTVLKSVTLLFVLPLVVYHTVDNKVWVKLFCYLLLTMYPLLFIVAAGRYDVLIQTVFSVGFYLLAFYWLTIESKEKSCDYMVAFGAVFLFCLFATFAFKF